MPKFKGFIVDKGSSPIDGRPYIAILTVKSENRKTGNMCQVWILREDVSPVAAIATGDDVSICGDCPHRRQANGKRSCYVNVGQSPNTIWKAYKRGLYPEWKTCDDAIKAALKGRKIRWGAYGDPSVIHLAVVEVLNSFASGHTGYTHQWRQPFAQGFKGVFQASCDGFQDYLDATAHGWKTFTVVHRDAQPKYAKQCPATVEDSSAQCMTCKLCDGAKTDIFVHAHGTGAKHIIVA